MDIKAEEISQIIRKQIEEYETEGLGRRDRNRPSPSVTAIARVYGSWRAPMAGELLEFPHEVARKSC